MKKSPSKSHQMHRDEGITLIEVLVSMTVLMFVSAGILQVFQLAGRTIRSDAASALSTGTLSVFRRSVSNDVSNSNGVVITNNSNPDVSLACTSWKSVDSSFAVARPLFTVYLTDPKTGVSSIVGYELRTNGGYSDLWRVICATVGQGAQILGSSTKLIGLPKPSDAYWNSSFITAIWSISASQSPTTNFPLGKYLLLNGITSIAKTLATDIADTTPTTQFALNDTDGVAKGMVAKSINWTNDLTTNSVVTDVTNDQVTIAGNSVAASANVNSSVEFLSVNSLQLNIPAGKNSKASLVTLTRRLA